jgi:hypothetical protein
MDPSQHETMIAFFAAGDQSDVGDAGLWKGNPVSETDNILY